MRVEEDNGSVGEEEEFQLRHITDALCDWKIILWCISNMAITTPSKLTFMQLHSYDPGHSLLYFVVYGASLFLP